MAEIAFIQTADTHGRLNAALAQQLGALKHKENALLFDCGDALDSANYLPRVGPGLSRVAVAMNTAGYDAMVMGNREYGWTRAATEGKLAGLEFPVLSANLAAVDSYDAILATTVIEYAGHRIGVLGLSPNMAPDGSLAHRASNQAFRDAEEAGLDALASLRPECDLVVGLIHWGTTIREQEELVTRLKGLDIALMGHWHVLTGSLTVMGGTVMSRCTCHAREAAIVRLLPDGCWEQEMVKL